MVNFYRIFAVVVLGVYASIVFTGWEADDTEHTDMPASVRSSPGGHRSYHFWFSGSHGGK